jgi:phosphoglycerol transferase MdoB-like AlkP superfamily enzyme
MTTFRLSSLDGRLLRNGTLRRFAGPTVLAALHIIALAVMLSVESETMPIAACVLTWCLLNCLWLVILRRPAPAAALSLAMVVALIAVSRFKHDVLWMTVNFMDLMIIDAETVSFLWAIYPDLRWWVVLAGGLTFAIVVAAWGLDRHRVSRWRAAMAALACAGSLTALALANPLDPGEVFADDNNVSIFARTGVEGLYTLATRGWMESDAVVSERLKLGMEESCAPAGRRPHIILVHDESSFDIRAIKDVKVPDGYGEHFQSFDGRQRTLLVEGAGGPSWYTEYNVLSGLSSRSFGRFQFFVTRIAAGRVTRGLPQALRHCGYRTFSIYPVLGGFLGTRGYYKGAGVEHFLDAKDIRGGVFEPDQFYFNYAARIMERERGNGPLFVHVYLTANHFPYNDVFRPDLTPANWRNPGNAMPEVNEYLRRQAMTERDYNDFLAHMRRAFPGEPFLIVRFGDHQPDFAKHIIDPGIEKEELSRRLQAHDPRYFSAYYAIDAINFRPRPAPSALPVLDAPYLALVVLEAAGLPLDPTFAEQKKILARCNGLFYGCRDGAEARRFNRLLIDAGLIKGL